MPKQDISKEKTQPLIVDLDNARYDDQRKVMEDIIDDNICPFCLENLERYHKHPILKTGKYWFVTKNQWPYEHTRLHLLAILNTHAEKLADVPTEAGAELLEIMKWAEKEYNIPGGGFAMRFGNTNYSAGSVAHLHAQLVVPDWESDSFQPVRIKIGKTKKKSE
jgi:ATP adenylyltransferase